MRRTAGFLAMVVLVAGCDSGEDGPLAVRDDVPGVEVLDPPSIGYANDTIQFTPPPPPEGIAGAVVAAELEYDVVRVAHIPARVVDGRTVQANDIIVDASGRRAYIAYNDQGAPWTGAIQALDVTDKSMPAHEWAVGFEYMDVNALFLDGNDLLIAGAIDPDESECDTRSYIMRLDLRTLDFGEMREGLVCLPSYAATGISRYNSRYFVSLGAADGSIHMLDTDLSILGWHDRGDVRDVESYQNGIIALAGSTDTSDPPGILISSGADVSDPDNRTEITIDGFGSDYHKATIEVYEGNIALLGLSEAGWAVWDLRSPATELAAFENPPCDAPLLCNTNSVSTDGDLIFTANGQYGFQVYKPQSKGAFDADELEPIGYYDVQADESWDPDYGDRTVHSANHVELKSRNLFVASGILGVFVYRLDQN